MLTTGAKPFTTKEGSLQCSLQPVLPAEWFTKEAQTIQWQGKEVEIPADSFACVLLNQTLLVYRNPEQKATYGVDAVRPICYDLDGVRVETGILDGEQAEQIRNGSCTHLQVWLGN